MKTIMNKLSSRKLWVTVGAVVGCVLTALCGELDNATRIAAIAGAVASSLGYVCSEASIDRSAVHLNESERRNSPPAAGDSQPV